MGDVVIIKSWKHMMEIIGTLTEEQLADSINHEAIVYKRKAIISRLHQRYNKVRCARERSLLMLGGVL